MKNSLKNNSLSLYKINNISLFIEKEYLDKLTISLYVDRLKKIIFKLNNEFSININKKIILFSLSWNFVSHIYWKYDRNKNKNIIFLSYFHKNKSPFVHELIHIYFDNYFSLWLREWFAVIMNDILWWDKCFPNFWNDVDLVLNEKWILWNNLFWLFKNIIFLNNWDYLFKSNVKNFKKELYLLSASFVKFLLNKYDIEYFLDMYSWNLKINKKDFIEWKNWLKDKH